MFAPISLFLLLCATGHSMARGVSENFTTDFDLERDSNVALSKRAQVIHSDCGVTVWPDVRIKSIWTGLNTLSTISSLQSTYLAQAPPTAQHQQQICATPKSCSQPACVQGDAVLLCNDQPTAFCVDVDEFVAAARELVIDCGLPRDAVPGLTSFQAMQRWHPIGNSNWNVLIKGGNACG